MKWIMLFLLVALPTASYSQDLGMWRDNSLGLSSTITLSKKNNTYYLTTVLDNSGKSVVEKLKKIQNKYIRVGFSDYYIIDNFGNLNCYDDQGLVFSANSIKNNNIKKSDQSSDLSCYEIGVRVGRCATLSMKGKVCSPDDDLVTPERCRGKSDTKNGIIVGTKSEIGRASCRERV